MTRELKLALIVGFALVLVVTVLISDHLSHARQTKLASLPAEPSKVTEPQPIALEAGAENLPLQAVNEPVSNEPQPIDRVLPGTDPEPVIIAQGSGTQPSGFGPVNPVSNTGAGLASGVQPQGGTPNMGNTATQPHVSQPVAGIDEAVRNSGGRIEGDVIYVPGVQTNRQQIGTTPVTPVSNPIANTARTDEVARGANAGKPGQLDVKPFLDSVTDNKPVVPASTDRIHVVASGDNMFKICQKYYGDGKIWRKLVKYNGLSDASQPALKIGQKLKVPASDVLLGKPAVREVVAAPTSSQIVPNVPGRNAQGPQTAPVAAAKTAKTRPYVVKKGDTLAAIAQKELGTVKRAKDILDLNKKVIKSADNVPQGVTIQLPA